MKMQDRENDQPKEIRWITASVVSAAIYIVSDAECDWVFDVVYAPSREAGRGFSHSQPLCSSNRRLRIQSKSHQSTLIQATVPRIGSPETSAETETGKPNER